MITPCALSSGQEAERLQERHRHGQVAGVLVDLVAAVLALAAERLERRDHARHQLHDDRGVDVRVHRRARRPRSSTGRRRTNRSRMPNSGVVLEELRELAVAVDARQRHLGQQPEDDQDPEDEEDPAPDVRRAEGVEQRLEHGYAFSSSVASASAVGRSSARRVGAWLVGVGCGLGGGLGGGAVGSARSSASASAAASSALGGSASASADAFLAFGGLAALAARRCGLAGSLGRRLVAGGSASAFWLAACRPAAVRATRRRAARRRRRAPSAPGRRLEDADGAAGGLDLRRGALA